MSTSRSVRFEPGPATAIVGPSSVALVDAAPDHPAVTRLKACLDDGLPLTETLRRLSALGLGDLPAFALAAEEPGAVRVIVRGRVGATVGGSPQHDATEVATWLELVDPAPGSPVVLSL